MTDWSFVFGSEGAVAQRVRLVLPGIDVDLEPEEIAEATNQRKVSQSVLDRLGED